MEDVDQPARGRAGRMTVGNGQVRKISYLSFLGPWHFTEDEGDDSKMKKR